MQCQTGTKWKTASEDSSKCRQSFTCGKIEYPDLKSPATNNIPKLSQLKCCLIGTSNGHFPSFIDKCDQCGWDNVAPTNCPVEMNDNECSWTEKEKM